MNDSLNPVWNQTFDFVVEDGLHDMLVLEVWDHDTFGKVKNRTATVCYLTFFILLRCNISCGFLLYGAGLHWEMHLDADKGYNGRGIQRLVCIRRIQSRQASVASQVDASVNLS